MIYLLLALAACVAEGTCETYHVSLPEPTRCVAVAEAPGYLCVRSARFHLFEEIHFQHPSGPCPEGTTARLMSQEELSTWAEPPTGDVPEYYRPFNPQASFACEGT